MAFKGKKDGAWSEASAVYGKAGDIWLYAKRVYGKKDGVWTAGWTDCRQHDAGGRDWVVADGVTEYQLTCGNRQSRIRTDYSKTGCTTYSRYSAWVASPDCNSACFDVTSGFVYSGTCNNRTYVTRTYYTPKTGSSCTAYHTDSAPTASPDCNSSCFTSSAVNCSGCGSATLYTANSGSGCTSYTTGSCGTWAETYIMFGDTVLVSNGYNGTYTYVTGSIFGGPYYTDSAGNGCASPCGCDSNSLIAPVGVEYCSVGGYRVVGGNYCLYV